MVYEPSGIFLPCSTHSLNLVVADAALACNEAVTFFGIVQEEHVSDLTVKPLRETRWGSRIDAVTPFRYQIGDIYDALYELSVDLRTDAFGKNTALSLARKLKSFKFVWCLTVWHAILFRINMVRKVLQRENRDISTAVELIAKIKSFLEHMRSDKVFPGKIKRQFDYESHDESTVNVDPKKAFKRNFFFYTLDRSITSLDELFDQLKAHYDIFGLLYNIKSQEYGLQQKCKDLQLALTYEGHRDLDAMLPKI
ncbi:hypothetical protein PR048_017664 [Dryococelus australis]|uniref:Transposase n=1 Tax=Dryococelus australis TaxID=614101 RepID=A0ABQ9HA37_9NEOP|nr:hypothetical protein PR048_017664 [Dryococelus australis]